MPTVRADDGTSIAYRISGDGPRNVLFMHGWGGSGAYWDELLRRLDLTGLRVITVDLRGHGDSDKPDTGFTLERFSDDMFAVADHAMADKIVIVGFSMSGKFAQHLAVARPERMLGQILVAGCPAAAVALPSEVQRDWVSRAGDWRRMREITTMFVTEPVEPEIFDRWADDAVKVPRVALDETLNMLTQVSFADQLTALRVPTLVVGGLHDPIFSPDALRDGVVSHYPGARLVVVNCNHEIPIEKPKELAAVVEAFLAGLGG